MKRRRGCHLIRSPEMVYGNGMILHPDGTPMFRCNQKKLNWYVSRGMAIVVGPMTARLTFTPREKGWAGDQYYLAPKLNRCVGCGSERRLTRHHIVPYCYRQHMPLEVKKSQYHDIVLLCWDCHSAYEHAASQLKMDLAKRYDSPIHGRGRIVDADLIGAKKAVAALERAGHLMPTAKRDSYFARLVAYLGREPTPQDTDVLKRRRSEDMTNFVSHGEGVMSQVGDLQAFTEMWRDHFMRHALPFYMPDGWDERRSIWRQPGRDFS